MPRADLSLRMGALVAGSALVVSAALVTVFRVPGFDLELATAANLGRVGVGLAAGAAFSVAGGLAALRGAPPLREAHLFAASCGAAAAAGVAIQRESGPLVAWLAAALGGFLLWGLARWVGPGRRSRPWLTVLLPLFLALGIGGVALANVKAPTHGLAWRLLGDLAPASVLSAALALVLVVSLVLVAARSVRMAGAPGTVASGVPEAGLAEVGAGTRVALEATLFGVGLGLAGPIAFIGLFAPWLAVRVLGAGVGAAAALGFSGVVGGAGVVAADAAARALVGGFALPLNVTIACVAVPSLLVWNRQRLAAESRPGLGLRAIELFSLALVAGILALLVYGFSSVVRQLT